MRLPAMVVRRLPRVLQVLDVAALCGALGCALWLVPPGGRAEGVALAATGAAAASLSVWVFGHSGWRYPFGSRADLLNTVACALVTGLAVLVVSTLYGSAGSGLLRAGCTVVLAVLPSAAAKSAALLARGQKPLSGPWPPFWEPMPTFEWRLDPAREERAGGRRALVLSFTPVTDEPRVRRQCDALWEEGWNVTVAGFRSHSPKPAHWQLLPLDPVQRERDPGSPVSILRLSLLQEAGRRTLRVALRLGRTLRPDSAWLAERYYWHVTPYARAYHALRAARRCGALGRCRLVVAHDWFTAPVCARFAREEGAAVTVDCHEYSSGQYMHDPAWVRHERPFVIALEQRYLPRVHAVTTVCEGIAELLAEHYRLPAVPTVIRSVARYQEVPAHDVREPLEIVYSGIIDPIRGLEELLRGVALAGREFRLVLRGPVTAGFDTPLLGLAEQLGIGERVRIEAPVPFSEIVLACSRSDIGYFVHEDVSPQKRFVLPNKFFEYVMAGLALCVSDLPEMARLVRRHDLGVLVPRFHREAIAESLTSLDPESVRRHRRNAREAARELCWERESHRMLALYEALLDVGRGPASEPATAARRMSGARRA